MPNEENILQTANAINKQTEAITAGFRELTILMAEHNAMIAKQNTALEELLGTVETLVLVTATANEIDLDELMGEADDEGDEAS
jgi:hypothetical protein